MRGAGAGAAALGLRASCVSGRLKRRLADWSGEHIDARARLQRMAGRAATVARMATSTGQPRGESGHPGSWGSNSLQELGHPDSEQPARRRCRCSWGPGTSWIQNPWIQTSWIQTSGVRIQDSDARSLVASAQRKKRQVHDP